MITHRGTHAAIARSFSGDGSMSCKFGQIRSYAVAVDSGGSLALDKTVWRLAHPTEICPASRTLTFEEDLRCVVPESV